jgi:hypothetical protein
MKRHIKGGPFVVALTNLRGHLRSCPACRSMRKGGYVLGMCEEGIVLTHEMALAATSLATQHRKAHDHPGSMIYPCPDVTKHGLAYSSTAQPYMATAVQDELF